jgi:hypothetical protein
MGETKRPPTKKEPKYTVAEAQAILIKAKQEAEMDRQAEVLRLEQEVKTAEESLFTAVANQTAADQVVFECKLALEEAKSALAYKNHTPATESILTVIIKTISSKSFWKDVINIK